MAGHGCRVGTAIVNVSEQEVGPPSSAFSELPPTPTSPDPDALPFCHVKRGSRKRWAERGQTEGCPVPAVTDQLCNLGHRMATLRLFSCDELEPFLTVGAPFKCKVSRFQGHLRLVLGQGLAACELEQELEQELDEEDGGTVHRAGWPPGASSVHGFPPPEGALAPWPEEGCSWRVWPALSCVVGDTARRSRPLTLRPASVPGASQGPPKSRELPLIFGKTGTCRQVTSVTD